MQVSELYAVLLDDGVLVVVDHHSHHLVPGDGHQGGHEGGLADGGVSLYEGRVDSLGEDGVVTISYIFEATNTLDLYS